MRSAIFLDRDGVINKVILKENKPCSPRFIEDFEFTADVENQIRRLKNSGFLTIVVTNQPDIARQLMSWDTLNQMHMMIYKRLLVDEIIVCSHDDNDNCKCRKPKPGMILNAVKTFDIQISSSYLIGDTLRDVLAARQAGIKPILIDTSYNQNAKDVLRVKDLSEAINFIINE